MSSIDGKNIVRIAAQEGDVGAFQLLADADPIIVEDISGRPMTVVPGDVFLSAAGFRESTRWAVGGIPDGGLVPGGEYWVLADCGLIGALVGFSRLEQTHLGRVSYLGVVVDSESRILNIRDFGIGAVSPEQDRDAQLFLVLGTSSEVGKTTAGLKILRVLLHQGLTDVIALKATGTPSVAEISAYRDFGATRAFDCVDFGVPSTYPSERAGIDPVFDAMLSTVFGFPTEAVIIECGGDMLGANVPQFVASLLRRRESPKVILVAADAPAAFGGLSLLRDMGIAVSLLTGPCTDTPTLRQRTEAICGVSAINLSRADPTGTWFDA